MFWEGAVARDDDGEGKSIGGFDTFFVRSSQKNTQPPLFCFKKKGGGADGAG